MYDKSWYKKLGKQLKKDDANQEIRGQETLLLRVELGLRLLERLELRDEVITVLWVLLSGLPIPDPRLEQLDKQQRLALANARVLLPFSGRFSWEAALRAYANIPKHWRSYDVQPEQFDRQVVDNARIVGHFDERITAYDACLNSHLPPSVRSCKPAPAGEVSFMPYLGQPEVTVTLPPELAENADVELPPFGPPPQRVPLHITIEMLRDAAMALDKREENKKKATWTERVDKILDYRVVQPDGTLGEPNAEPLELNGMAHVVGMVGAGKSTLMQLLAAHAVLNTTWRVTLIVGDTMTTLTMADKLNRLLSTTDESPVAVALLGRTTRERHLKQLYNSGDFHEDHIGLRWLNTACPLQGLASLDKLPQPIRVGKEPCNALMEPLEPNQRADKPRERMSCPLFALCPSQQLYRDMPGARIWITTPGALGSSSVPLQLDKRGIKIGDLVYEHSDIVVFDEVDTIQEWFDNLYAPETKLVDPEGKGVLDQADVEISQRWIPQRTLPPYSRRWIQAQRHTVSSASNVLSQLEKIEILPAWVKRNYFTALSLFYKLSRRLVGLPDYASDQEDHDLTASAQPLFRDFAQLIENDPLGMKKPSQQRSKWSADRIYRLSLIAKAIVAEGDSTQGTDIVSECVEWLQEFVPNLEETLAKLDAQRAAWLEKKQALNRPPKEPQPDDLYTLAQRLEFALNVAVLDRNMRIVSYEWEATPVTSALGDPPARLSSNLSGILPIPPTGKLFGSYYSQDMNTPSDLPPGEERPPSINHLSQFGYNNVGRWYVRHFHEVRADLEGTSGPHVLAMSGTSWLPDSSRWHFDSFNQLPQGVLVPPEKSMDAIEKSVFTFFPQYEADSKKGLRAIRVSGHPDKRGQIKKIVRKLASTHRAPLQQKLTELEDSSTKEIQSGRSEKMWRDRARLLLLVNSYEQAKWAAQEMALCWPNLAQQIYALTRGDQDEPEEMLVNGSQLVRADIEKFAQTGGKILLAPLQAIGRGYNILNNDGIAAFGAVYFLTRPMPYPFDTQAMVRELNYYTLKWCQDPNFGAWQEAFLYEKGLALRREASRLWRKMEARSYYKRLEDWERNDLAATTAGLIIQACGRLLRGGVPFHATFVDAAWAPNSAQPDRKKPDTPQNSLLAAIIQVLEGYIQKPIGEMLYEPLYLALADTKNFGQRV